MGFVILENICLYYSHRPMIEGRQHLPSLCGRNLPMDHTPKIRPQFLIF